MFFSRKGFSDVRKSQYSVARSVRSFYFFVCDEDEEPFCVVGGADETRVPEDDWALLDIVRAVRRGSGRGALGVGGGGNLRCGSRSVVNVEDVWLDYANGRRVAEETVPVRGRGRVGSWILGLAVAPACLAGS